jgi:hypothetical protein
MRGRPRGERRRKGRCWKEGGRLEYGLERKKVETGKTAVAAVELSRVVEVTRVEGERQLKCPERRAEKVGMAAERRRRTTIERDRELSRSKEGVERV